MLLGHLSTSTVHRLMGSSLPPKPKTQGKPAPFAGLCLRVNQGPWRTMDSEVSIYAIKKALSIQKNQWKKD